MTSQEIRKRFIDYFTKVLKAKNMEHVEVASSSLVPEQHPTLLFTNSGMVQFTPYFLGEKDALKDFGSNRLCSFQKCVRTVDLDIVGESKYHLTFFEMLGSWSIGDYGKKDAIKFSFDLLTNKDYGFGFDVEKLIPTVFCGNDEAPCDDESIEAWKSVGIFESNISKLPAKENWWAPAGLTGPGPCGPATEILFDRGEKYGPKEEVPGQTDNPRYIEIWNAGVFMQYNRNENGKLEKLPMMSVDTGAGLERFAVLLQNVDSVYEIDLFVPIVEKIIDLAQKTKDGLDMNNPSIKKAVHRASDHIKAATFMISDNVYPSNKDQGYVLRRLIRTAFNDFTWGLNIDSEKIVEVIPVITEIYRDIFPEINDAKNISDVFESEHDAYNKVANNARKYIRKNYVNKNALKIEKPFDIYQSTGAPVELIKNLISETSLEMPDFSSFEKDIEDHQNLSRAGGAEKFKGGLSGTDTKQTRLHTATHLLQQALRDVLGSSVKQMGSNITTERLRFDYSFDAKVTPEEIENVEKAVNEKIEERHSVNSVLLFKKEAEKSGALSFFKEKYPEKVTVYFTGDTLENAYSKEFCGGPHVKNLSEIGKFRILKEESIGKGVRRIKAVVE